MERIKEAIQKAKAQRGDVLSLETGAELRRLHEVARNELEDIEYHDTRVVSLDPVHLEASRIVAANRNDPRGAAFDLLRTQVIRKMRDNGWKTMAVTSPTAGCGKTIVAINLAISLAHQTDQTALLADFDLRRPKIASYLGLNVRQGLAGYLLDNTPLAGALVNPGIPRLVVLPNDRPIPNAAETLTAGQMKELVEDLKTRYESRTVMFDLPPLLSTDDALAFLPQVDCVLLVVANHLTTKSEIEQSQHLLKNANLLGVVLNKAEGRKPGHYY